MMRISPGIDEEHREVELTTTEARQARSGYIVNVLVFGLAGVIVAFLPVYFLFIR